MAQKRKIQEAFGKPGGNLSAFAAARLAKQPKATLESELPTPTPTDETASAVSVAQVPYDGHHDDISPSSDDGVGGPEPELPPSLQLPATTLSTIRSGSIKQHDDGSLEIRLKAENVVVCVGIYDVEVLKGLATIYGATLTPNSGRQRVYAPSTHALPQIVSRRDGTIIKLSHGKSSLGKLEKLSPLFKNIWTKSDGKPETFAVLHSTDDDQLRRSLGVVEIDRTTQQLLASFAIEANHSKTSRIMAVGAKSSGKSTLNRLLCNALATKRSSSKVLYLDLDPGQPEFGPPGQVSLVEVSAPLLGPAFTHLAGVKSCHYKLISSHTVAATSFKDDPNHYLACVRELMRHVQPRQPVIVNSCGWVGGLGGSVLVDLARIIGVTNIIVMGAVEDELLKDMKAVAPASILHTVARQPARPAQRTPAELRAMQTMAYFHQVSLSGPAGPKWSAKLLSSYRPWTVKYAGSHPDIHAIASYGQAPSPEYLAEVLDGSVVAIVVMSEHHLAAAIQHRQPDQTDTTADDEAGIQRTPEFLPYLPTHNDTCPPLDPKYSSYIGLALVRAIDPQQKTLHLITPLPSSQIDELVAQKEKVVLVRGGFDAPEWAYLEDLYRSDDKGAEGVSVEDRPWVSRREPVGIEGAVWRLRHTPLVAVKKGG